MDEVWKKDVRRPTDEVNSFGHCITWNIVLNWGHRYF